MVELVQVAEGVLEPSDHPENFRDIWARKKVPPTIFNPKNLNNFTILISSCQLIVLLLLFHHYCFNHNL